MVSPESVPPVGRSRWYMPTPGTFVSLLLLMVVSLYFSDRYDWFAFNRQKGWTVLIATATVAVGFVVLALWAGGTYLFGRKPQFALATLLLLIVVAALPCAWLTHEMRKAEQQASAIAQIQVRGGRVDFQMSSPLILRRAFVRIDPLGDTPQWLRGVFGDEFFREVVALEVNDQEDLVEAESLRKVKHLSSSSEATILDDDLDFLANFPELESISFEDTEITDAGLKNLQTIKSLKDIFIARSSTTTDGRNRFKQKFAGTCLIRVKRSPGGAIDLSSYPDSLVDPETP